MVQPETETQTTPIGLRIEEIEKDWTSLNVQHVQWKVTDGDNVSIVDLYHNTFFGQKEIKVNGITVSEDKKYHFLDDGACYPLLDPPCYVIIRSGFYPAFLYDLVTVAPPVSLNPRNPANSNPAAAFFDPELCKPLLDNSNENADAGDRGVIETVKQSVSSCNLTW